jgi:hypothetical protein
MLHFSIKGTAGSKLPKLSNIYVLSQNEEKVQILEEGLEIGTGDVAQMVEQLPSTHSTSF